MSRAAPGGALAAESPPTVPTGDVPYGTHHFALDDTMSAYDTFADAGVTHALKVVLEGTNHRPGSNGRIAESVPTGVA